METLSFSSSLGNVPNRGLEDQNDSFVNGVPYVQAIKDVTDTDTGKSDGRPTGIHFEPGLWMRIPATTTRPVLANSLVRMASIPHGTTVFLNFAGLTWPHVSVATLVPGDPVPVPASAWVA
jgi:hypothetical protein